MASPKIFISNITTGTGFTLIEVLIVLSLLGMIAGTTLLFSLSSYQSTLLQAEHDSLVMQLQTVRALAMQNKNNASYGLAIFPGSYNGYIIFAGSSFTASDITTQLSIPSRGSVMVASTTPAEIVFAPLSGVANYDGEIKLRDSSRAGVSTTITVNYEGGIY